MKALVYHRPGHVEVNDVADPKIEDPHDIILRVTSTAICGSDLHIYNGFFPQVKDLILGHEFMGVVEETGADVKNLAKGDRVVVPFPIACGQCFFCQSGLPGHCENSNPEHYGPEGRLLSEKGGGLFGYTDLYGGYSGGQAEYVRVPYGDFGPRKVGDNYGDEDVLFLTDIFPTGYSAIDWAGVKGGETVAVFGCGPVGLMAQKVAWLRGAKRVIGVDIQQSLLATARGPYDAYPLGQIFDKGIRMAFGQAPVQKYMDELIRLLDEKKIRLDDIITHRLPLSNAPHGYEIFCEKKDGCVKVVLKP